MRMNCPEDDQSTRQNLLRNNVDARQLAACMSATSFILSWNFSLGGREWEWQDDTGEVTHWRACATGWLQECSQVRSFRGWS